MLVAGGSGSTDAGEEVSAAESRGPTFAEVHAAIGELQVQTSLALTKVVLLRARLTARDNSPPGAEPDFEVMGRGMSEVDYLMRRITGAAYQLSGGQ